MSEIEAVLGPAGPLARALSGFKARPVQQAMAARIEAALYEREVLMVEAGTGTGKTYAYLVPALLSGLRVLISTGTRTLQDQLFHRDLPLLGSAIGRPARVALLKGRSNYLCRARLLGVGQQAELLPAVADRRGVDGGNAWGRALEWARASATGDLSELAEFGEEHPLRTQLSSTRESCTGARCPEYTRCHLFGARHAAMEADIVVVNHHLLLADMALKEDGFGDLLPSVDAVILDEAHQLPDLASEFFGVSLSMRQIELLLADLRRPRHLSAPGATAPGATAPGATAPGATAPGATAPGETDAQMRRLAEPVARALHATHAALGRAERHLSLRELPSPARRALAELGDALISLDTQLAALAGRVGEIDAAGDEAGLAACAARAAAQAQALRQICAFGTGGADGTDGAHAIDGAAGIDGAEGTDATEGARTVSTDARGFVLRLLPYDIAPRFRAFVRGGSNGAHERRTAWILTSATLAVGGDFAHFANRLGVQDAASLCLPSPFDYEHQALMYLPEGMPEPSREDFIPTLLEKALPLIEAAGGGAFLLFTSLRAMRLAAGMLAERLPSALPLLVQGTAPREQLLRRFRASGEAVLLGSASFWEGVDVQGSALRLVIIDKLPFASPEDPVVRARIEHLQSQGASPFRDYQLPEAVLALKQGVGRLIRSEYDGGVVMIGDPRLTARVYGRLFRASLPAMPVTREAAAACARLAEVARDESALHELAR